MITIPKDLISLEKRESELTFQLERLINEELDLKKRQPLYFKLNSEFSKQGPGQVGGFFFTVISLTSTSFFFVTEFKERKSFDFLFPIMLVIISLFIGFIAALFCWVLLYEIIEFILIRIKKIPRTEYFAFKKKRKTQLFSKHLLKSELGVVRLKIKELLKKSGANI